MKLSAKIVWVLIFGSVLAWSGIHPKDLFTWFLEVLPALIAIVIMAATYSRFELTPLAYWLILSQCLILMVGGHYTYAEVPLFDWIRDACCMDRNNYDKVGHFAQGFVPALVAREILLRQKVVAKRAWLPLFLVSICLAVSALYELFEWQVAVWTGTAAEAFLGTQGDPWDTQSDMAFALIGAIAAVLFLPRLHDRQLAKLEAGTAVNR